MGNLNQVIVVFHRLAVMTEKVFYEIAVIFLRIEPIVFNAPSSATIKNSRGNIFPGER